MYSPNWYLGLLSERFWPDRPREPYNWNVNFIALAVNTTQVQEVPLAKRYDALVFGGCALVTNTDNSTLDAPNSAIWSQMLINITNPAGNHIYMQGFSGNADEAAPFVPIENVLSPAWGIPAQRPVYWPVPIPVRKGGSLQVALRNIGSATHTARITFWCAVLFDKGDRLVA